MSAPLKRNAASAYAQVGIETGVEAADPHRLISMLFEGAVKACKQAIAAMEVGDIAAKGQLLGKAMDIILVGLKAGLNMEAGGELSQNLSALYDHMTYQLFLANAENHPEKVHTVIHLLEDLKEAWDQVPALMKAGGAVASVAPSGAPVAPSAPSGTPVSSLASPSVPAVRPAKLYGSV